MKICFSILFFIFVVIYIKDQAPDTLCMLTKETNNL